MSENKHVNLSGTNRQVTPMNDEHSLMERRWVLTGRFDEIYTTAPCEDLSSSLQDTDIFYIYRLYDALLERYPDMMSKKLLGHGTGYHGESDERLPIYEYRISAPETIQRTQTGTSTDLEEAPLMLITSGVHGYEKAAVYGVYEFVKQMLEKPLNSLAMESILSNFSFKIIPIVNPGGYNDNDRNNRNGVNINRNFSYQWEDAPDKEKGIAPYSENETRIIGQWLKENRHAYAYLDFHNLTRKFPGRHRAMTSYHLSPNKQLDKMYSSLIRILSRRWKKTYLSCYTDLGDIAFGFLTSDFYRHTPNTINEAYHVYGIPLAATPESANEDPADLNKENTKAVLEMTVEIYANYIFSMVHNFR